MPLRTPATLLITLLLTSCTTGELSPEGRPCQSDSECGPGTVCDTAAGKCQLPGTARDQGRADRAVDTRPGADGQGDGAVDLPRPDLAVPDQAPPPDAGCPPGKTWCGGACVDTKVDKNHCGKCGHTCPAGADRCVNSQCVCGAGNTQCGPGLDCLGGQCTCKAGGSCKGCCSGNVCLAAGSSAQSVFKCGSGGAACKSCVDSNVCTSESCLAGACKYANAPSTTVCSDANPCTYNDKCSGQKCVGLSYHCDDSKSCTTDICTGQAPPAGCINKLQTGYCLIGGACYSSGVVWPGASHGCYRCEPTKNTTNWSLHAGCLITLAGDGSYGLTNGAAASARFYSPKGIAADTSGGTVYVADRANHQIRRIAKGIVSTFAGSSAYGYLDGAALSARFNQPSGLALDSLGNLYVADRNNHRIRQISSAGAVTTVAGSGLTGSVNGAALSASFYLPQAVAVYGTSTLYVADFNNHLIRRIDSGYVYTHAGTTAGYLDGAASSAKFYGPAGIALYGAATVYVAGMYNHRVRRIYGSNVYAFAGTGAYGQIDGYAASATFRYPQDVVVGSLGEVYVADTSNNVVRKIYGGQVSTFVGSTASASGFIDGLTSSARLYAPNGLAFASDMLFISDSGNHAIRVVATR